MATVLVVEDEDVTRLLLESGLRGPGQRVRPAARERDLPPLVPVRTVLRREIAVAVRVLTQLAEELAG